MKTKYFRKQFLTFLTFFECTEDIGNHIRNSYSSFDLMNAVNNKIKNSLQFLQLSEVCTNNHLINAVSKIKLCIKIYTQIVHNSTTFEYRIIYCLVVLYKYRHDSANVELQRVSNALLANIKQVQLQQLTIIANKDKNKSVPKSDPSGIPKDRTDILIQYFDIRHTVSY